MSWPWDALGLDGPAELREIRRAYAEKLKTVRPEEQPEEFHRLHSAYQSASRHAREAKRREQETQEAQEMHETHFTDPAEFTNPEDLADHTEFINPAEFTDHAEFTNPAEFEDHAKLTVQDTSPISPDSGDRRDWDFARLFAEGEAERRGKQFQKAMELRRANTWRDSAWTRPNTALEAGRIWLAVSAALSLLELLDSAGSPPPAWRNFLETELFEDVKNRPDFIYGLEAFLQDRPKFPREIRWAFFQAYGFQRGRIRREYRPLYRLLGGWEFRDVPRLAAVCLFTPVFLTILMLLFPRFSWQDRVSRWMEEDFGQAFEALDYGPGRFLTLRGRFRPIDGSGESDPPDQAGENADNVTEDADNIGDNADRSAANDPPPIFLASLSGRRNRESGARGYRTNYTVLLLSRELEAFAADQDWGVTLNGMDRAVRSTKETPEIYLFLPLTGAGDGITALGDLLSALSEEDWYRELPPEYQLFLCYENWCFDHTLSTETDFSARNARNYYENELIPALKSKAALP